MDLESVFMSVFCIGKKPDNIFELIKAAITVGEYKYPKEFKKHQNKILKQLMNSGVLSAKEDFDNGYEDEEEQMEQSFVEDQENHEKQTTQSFNKTNIETQGKNMNTTVTSMSIKKHKQLDDGDQKGRKQSQSNILQTTTTINLKSATKVDCGRVMRKSGKGFKNIDADAQSNNLQATTVNLKSATNGVMRKSGKGFKKMDIESDAQTKKNADTTLTATKHCTEEILMNKKRLGVDFESSKRKYEDRLAEQNKAKRRTIMVDFHEMPTPAKDPCAPKRCWERRRF